MKNIKTNVLVLKNGSFPTPLLKHKSTHFSQLKYLVMILMITLFFPFHSFTEKHPTKDKQTLRYLKKGSAKRANFKVKLTPQRSTDFNVPLNPNGTILSVKFVPDKKTIFTAGCQHSGEVGHRVCRFLNGGLLSE